ncbi:dihydrodipicolinate synthase family protein [Agromyces sp. SYSU T00194]|uniref:dihydrodipicolinate synthase family protein n=1 Tax=Agromyces chitinivorans TaxID=3158560 RepID=UPI00339B245F
MSTNRTRIREALGGVIAVLITPYAEGTVDVSALTGIARRLDDAGIHVLTALGNTAEVFQLTAEERVAHLRAVAAGTDGSLLIAGVAGASATVLANTDAAAALGYDLTMVHEPADPFGDSAGFADYYLDIADRSALPLVIYLRTERLDTLALSDLSHHANIAGVKYARRSLDALTTLLADANGDCVWINGAAEARAPEFLTLGLTGFTSGIANARPDLALRVHEALVVGDDTRLARAVAPLSPVEDIRAEGNGRFNVAVLKEILRCSGIETGPVRAPHSELTPSAKRALHAAIAAWPTHR